MKQLTTSKTFTRQYLSVIRIWVSQCKSKRKSSLLTECGKQTLPLIRHLDATFVRWNCYNKNELHFNGLRDIKFKLDDGKENILTK